MRKPKDILDKKLYAFFMIYGIKTSDKSIPYIVQAMQEYAKEYHQSELLKLNKSDVKFSFSELSEMILKHKAKSEYKQASIVILRNIFEENGI